MLTENNPQGLSLDQAFTQLKANRQQAPQQEHLEDENVEVVEEEAIEGNTEYEFEEDTEEGTEESETEEEEVEPEEAEDEEIFELEIDGEQVDVSLDELHKGYLRHNDYTRKRQIDAKKAKDSELQYATKLQTLETAIAQNTSQEQQQYQQVVKAMNESQDPAQKRDLHYKALQLQQAISQRQALHKQTTDLQARNKQAQEEASLNEQVALLATEFEDWDTKKEELAGYLQSNGVTDFSPYINAQMAIFVDKAKQFDALQQQRKTVVSKKIRRKVPKTLKAGQGEQSYNVNNDKVKSLSNNFSQSGNIKDALALMQAKRGQ